MKLLSFKHIFILGALLAAGSVQVHAADEVTGKSEELELTDSIVHDTQSVSSKTGSAGFVLYYNN